MKKINLTFLIILIGIASIFLPRQANAQAPNAFKYQAVVRDNSGEIIVNQLVSIRCSIIHDSINGSVVFSETHNITTNQFGMVVLEIGRGTIETGVFENIDWGITSHFLKLELDESGGTNYQFMGTSELLSVPYSINSASLILTSPSGGNYEVSVDEDGNLVANNTSSCTPLPSKADAGPNQLYIVSPATLAANNPDLGNGTGIWTIISGTGGNFSDPNDPASSFSGMVDSSYILRWTISTVCDSSMDEVNILFHSNACPPTVTDIDGNTYNTTNIGGQCWMAENLKTTTYQNGTPIPNISDSISWSNPTSGAYVWYDNDISWKDLYGALYSWYAVVSTNGLCPSGWHISTYEEWVTLVDYIGNYASIHLKSCRQVNAPSGGDCNTNEHPRWEYFQDDTYGLDTYNFSALPGGQRDHESTYSSLGYHGNWWTTSEYSYQKATHIRFYYQVTYIPPVTVSKKYGISVRCVRN